MLQKCVGAMPMFVVGTIACYFIYQSANILLYDTRVLEVNAKLGTQNFNLEKFFLEKNHKSIYHQLYVFVAAKLSECPTLGLITLT